ncbi:DUF302 domain-containing protein [Duganella margarita]|nr:DUF302 domain-containing protein [Duganella margarita]
MMQIPIPRSAMKAGALVLALSAGLSPACAAGQIDHDHQEYGMNGATTAIPAAAPQELLSADDYPTTLTRLVGAFEAAGMTVFARIDHSAGAAAVGLSMPPATVLIYGNPRGGTPAMQAAPTLALDLPLRVLVRQDETGATRVAFHSALELVRRAGLPDQMAAPLLKAEALIAATVKP